jgi:hypothetical protein
MEGKAEEKVGNEDLFMEIFLPYRRLPCYRPDNDLKSTIILACSLRQIPSEGLLSVEAPPINTRNAIISGVIIEHRAIINELFFLFNRVNSFGI